MNDTREKITALQAFIYKARRVVPIKMFKMLPSRELNEWLSVLQD